MTSAPTGNRLDRRKAVTRAALVAAGRRLLETRDPSGVSIQEITEAADVGFGTFYNHFESKHELFAAAVEDVLEEHGAMLDRLTSDLEDPAEVMAAAVRISARFPVTHREIARVIDRTGSRYLTASSGLPPRALRDLKLAKDAGRFSFGDPDVALACAGGAMIGVLHLGLSGIDRSAVDRAADELAYNVLRMFGLSEDDARDVVSRPLPQPR
jgi:AcrR family transcriptional regulator